MNTIFYNDNTITYTSLLTINHCIIDNDYDILIKENEDVFFIPGSVKYHSVFIEYYLGEKKRKPVTLDALVISEDKLYLCSLTSEGSFSKILLNKTKPLFIGDGSRYGLGALDAGAEPLEAFNIATNRGLTSRGAIRTYDLIKKRNVNNHGWKPDRIISNQ